MEDSSSEKGALLIEISGGVEDRADEDDEEDFLERLCVWLRCAELGMEEDEEDLEEDEEGLEEDEEDDEEDFDCLEDMVTDGAELGKVG